MKWLQRFEGPRLPLPVLKSFWPASNPPSSLRPVLSCGWAAGFLNVREFSIGQSYFGCDLDFLQEHGPLSSRSPLWCCERGVGVAAGASASLLQMTVRVCAGCWIATGQFARGKCRQCPTTSREQTNIGSSKICVGTNYSLSLSQAGRS